MGLNTKISWCDHTNNLWWGCEEVHRGCDNCYARTLAKRCGKDVWGGEVTRERKVNALKDLNKFQRKAKEAGKKATVFCGSMMDIFEKSKPLSNPTLECRTTGDLRDLLFRRIDEEMFPDLIFLFLTKRTSNIPRMIPIAWLTNPPKNVWFGSTVVNQKTLYQVSRHMMKVPGNIFYSVEPLFEDINIKSIGNMGRKYPNWIIVGGESGHGKRSFDVNWGQRIGNDCKELQIPFFYKQIDKVTPVPEHLLIREFPEQFQK